jgi:hypothetical protein
MSVAKWKKNTIFEAIVAAKLEPIQFDLNTDQPEWRLEHVASGSKFLIVPDGAHYAGTHLIAGDGLAWPYDAYSWDRVIDHVGRWLNDVKRDIETPDLWAELRAERNLLGAGPFQATDNTPFTPDEQEEIARRLQELSDYMKRTYPLTASQAVAFASTIVYLTEAARRLPRIDWRNVFIGTFCAYMLEVAIPPEAARDILLMLLKATGHFFGTHIPELPSG